MRNLRKHLKCRVNIPSLYPRTTFTFGSNPEIQIANDSRYSFFDLYNYGYNPADLIRQFYWKEDWNILSIILEDYIITYQSGEYKSNSNFIVCKYCGFRLIDEQWISHRSIRAHRRGCKRNLKYIPDFKTAFAYAKSIGPGYIREFAELNLKR